MAPITLDKTKRAAKTCLDICKELADGIGDASEAVARLAEQLSNTDDTDELLKSALKALDMTLKCGIKVQLSNSGHVYHTGKKAHIIRRRVQPLTWACKDVSKLFKDAGDLASFGASKVTLAHISKCRADQPDAPNHMLKACEEAVAIFREIHDVAGEAGALQCVLDAHLIKAALSPFKEVKMEQTSLALEAASAQLELYQSLKDSKGESQALNNLATVLMGEGDFQDMEKAEEHAEASFKLAKQIGEQELEVTTLRTLMGVRMHTEGPYEVERLADEAARRWRRTSPGKRQNDEAWAHQTAADALVSVGEAGEALDKARQSLEMYETAQDKEGQAKALETIVACLRQTGELEEASETLTDAIRLYGELGDHRSEAALLLQAVIVKIQSLELPQLADCFFSRDIEAPTYNVTDSHLYRAGDEGLRLAKRASALFAQIDEPSGQQYVEDQIQESLETAIQAYIRRHQPIQEKVMLEKDGMKQAKRVGVWLIQMPRIMSVAKSDEERARATLRIERDPPKRIPKKLKVGDDSSSGSSESESEDEEEEEEEEAETQVAVYSGPSREDLLETVKATALDLMGSDDLGDDTPLMDAGLDSLAAVEFQGILAKFYTGMALPATLIFDYPSVSSIADMMNTELRAAWVPPVKGEKVPKVKKVKAPKQKKKKKDKRHREEPDEYVQETVQEEAPTQKVAVYTGPSKEELTEAIKANALDLTGGDEVDNDTPLMDAGLDSLAAVEFQGMLAKEFQGIALPSTLIFDYPSVNSIAELMHTESRTAQGF